MEVVDRPGVTTSLMIKGLSYSDWEDEADQLRQAATGLGAVRKNHLTRAQKLLSDLQDELDAIDSVSPTLTGFDAIRVGCVRDLLVALKVSLEETQRLLKERAPKSAPKSRKARASTH
jgi:hypothetical protein